MGLLILYHALPTGFHFYKDFLEQFSNLDQIQTEVVFNFSLIDTSYLLDSKSTFPSLSFSDNFVSSDLVSKGPLMSLLETLQTSEFRVIRPEKKLLETAQLNDLKQTLAEKHASDFLSSISDFTNLKISSFLVDTQRINDLVKISSVFNRNLIENFTLNDLRKTVAEKVLNDYGAINDGGASFEIIKLLTETLLGADVLKEQEANFLYFAEALLATDIKSFTSVFNRNFIDTQTLSEFKKTSFSKLIQETATIQEIQERQ
jgi:hypothetical protein